VGVYFDQGGTTNYLMTGGSISTNSGVLGWGNGTTATLTINGPAAVASFATLNLNTKGIIGYGGWGTLNLENGSLAIDDLVTYWPSGSPQGGGSTFNFSGGTLQPVDSSVKEWGSNAAGNNITITLSGSGAVMSSTDLSGNPQTVPVYASLTGSGAVTFTGAGTLVVGGTTGNPSNYSGGSFVTGAGTVQLATASGLGTGPLTVTNGAVDLAGLSPTIGGLSGGSGGLIANLSGATNSTLTVSQSGSSLFGGTLADGPTNTLALALTGGGELVLAGTDTYSGGTTVEAGTLAIASNTALPDGSSLIVGAGGTFLFDPSAAFAPASASAVSPQGAAAVPEPAAGALLVAAAMAGLIGWRRRRAGR
jgi:autotransporter-associated beta strand protein